MLLLRVPPFGLGFLTRDKGKTAPVFGTVPPSTHAHPNHPALPLCCLLGQFLPEPKRKRHAGCAGFRKGVSFVEVPFWVYFKGREKLDATAFVGGASPICRRKKGIGPEMVGFLLVPLTPPLRKNSHTGVPVLGGATTQILPPMTTI